MKKINLLLFFMLIIILISACGKTTAVSSAIEKTNNNIEESKKTKEDDTTKNNSKVASNGYSIGNNIYILGVLDNVEVQDFSEGLAIVKNKETNKYGCIDKSGQLVIDYMYDDAWHFSDGLVAVKKNHADKWGFIDKNGKLVIDYMYDDVYCFLEGFLPVKNNVTEKYGYIDKNGELVIDYIYSYASDFSEGLAAVVNPNTDKWGFIDKNGKLVIDYMYDSVGNFSEGLAWVYNNDIRKYGFINKNGKQIIDYIYEFAYPFSEGLAAVGNPDTWKFGFIDRSGKLIIDYKYDAEASLRYPCFSEGLVHIGYGEGKYGFIDKNENVVINDNGRFCRDFSEGLSVVDFEMGHKSGCIDKKDNYVIQPVLDNLTNFSEGIALAEYNDKAILLTYLNPYDLGYTSNQLLNAKNILLANDTDGFFTEYYNSLEKTEPNWIINTSNWNDNDYKKDLEKTIKEKEVKPDTWYVTEAGIWYYFDDDRTTKKTGWYKDPEDNQTYYLNPKTGIMATGWTEIDGDMYYFNDQHGNDPNWFYNAEKDIWASAGKDVKSYGSMFRDEETPDGKRVDAEGRLIE